MDDGAGQSKWDSESAAASSAAASSAVAPAPGGGDGGEREVPLTASLCLMLGLFGAASGLLALGGVLGAVALALGLLARRAIRRDPALGGGRRVLVGMLAGGLGIALSVMVLGAMFAVHITNRTLVEHHARQDCKDNLKSFQLAMYMYSDAADGWLPDELEPMRVAGDVNRTRLLCPSSPADRAEEYFANTAESRDDYVYAGSGIRVSTEGLQRTPIMWDGPENHQVLGPYMTVLFANGDVEGVPYGSLEALLAGDSTVVSPERARAMSAADAGRGAGATAGAGMAAGNADGGEVDGGEVDDVD